MRETLNVTNSSYNRGVVTVKLVPFVRPHLYAFLFIATRNCYGFVADITFALTVRRSNCNCRAVAS
jgi:hypothetical protein